MVATYRPETDILTESKVDLDLAEIKTYLAADDVQSAMGVYATVTNSDQSLESISSPGYDTMAGTFNLRTWWDVYMTFWGEINYADVFVDTYVGGTYQVDTKRELIQKGIAYQGVWMQAVHKFEAAIASCKRGDTADVVQAKQEWDRGMAYYVGSLEGTTTGASAGNLLYNLAQKRCEDFGTCATTTDASTIAAANAKVVAHATAGMAYFVHAQLLCTDPQLRNEFEGIVSQMTVPLVQGLLKYAWKADPAQTGGSCSGAAGLAESAVSADCAKSWAEGWAFSAAVLPQIHECDSMAATTVRANLDIDGAEPMVGGAAAVKDAVESVYGCLGITCTDVGAYQAGGSVFAGMGACTFDAATQTTGSTEAGGGTVAMTDAAARRAGAALAAALVAAVVA